MGDRSEVGAGLPRGPFQVVLCEEDSSPEVVATVDDYQEAEAWVREWLMEPLGLAVGIRAIPIDTIAP